MMKLHSDILMTFEVPPKPAIRMTQGQVKMCRIPEQKLSPKQRPVVRKIKEYEAYKQALLILAMAKRFTLPTHDFHMIFYLETANEALWDKPHDQRTPDTDNLIKGVKDGLLKKDHAVWDYRATKLWTGPGKGRIEIRPL